MYSVSIPGVGIVEVDSDEALRKLRAKLAAKTKNPEPQVDIAKVISDSNKQLVIALTSAIGRIEKPIVNVPAPVVNYTPPDIKVNVPAPIVNITQEAPDREEDDEEENEPIPPIKAIRAVSIERDWRGLITEASFEVIR